MSEGLKGFPCPLIPPEMLKPRPGFFSIRTQNCKQGNKTILLFLCNNFKYDPCKLPEHTLWAVKAAVKGKGSALLA